MARTVVDGFINGMHRSPYFGASVDFAEHRGYMPGDDIRRVDWRLFARTDRYYIKEYEADTNANFSVLLDVSKSMGFGSRGMTKLEYGKMLAGCLTYLVHRQRDRVGLAAFDDDIVEHVPPSAKHMDVVLHMLDRLKPSSPGSLRAPLQKMAEHFGRRGLLVLISDLYEEPEAVLEAVAPLRFRGNDIDRVPRARSGGDRFHLPTSRRRSRIWRAASRSRSCRRRWPSSTARWCRRTSTRCGSGFRPTASTTRWSTRRRRSITRCSATCRCASGCRGSARAMSFLTPLFLVGLAGLAIPVILHLIQRERKNVVEFPSLMFLRRIPVSVGPAAPHPPLAAAAACGWRRWRSSCSAFARPFLRRHRDRGRRAGGAREVVILVDRSYSMGYGDGGPRRWRPPSDAINGLTPADRASLVLFSSGAEVAVRSAADRGRLARGRRPAEARRRAPRGTARR